MRLKTVLDDIKWVGVDRGHFIRGYKEKPVYHEGSGNFMVSHGTSCRLDSFLLVDLIPGKLYRLEGQELIEHIEIPKDGEPVIVWGVREKYSERRYSTGILDLEEGLVCYPEGRTKWSNGGLSGTSNFGWKTWRLPTTEELN